MRNSLVFFLFFTRLIVFSQSAEGDNYQRFSGKIIRQLDIETYDPAGVRIYDIAITNTALPPRVVNAIHYQTKPKTVRRLLLFEVGDTVNPFEVYESERLLRRILFIRDCFIKMNPVAGDTNSVNILLVMQDRFSIGLNATLGNAYRLSLSERNIMGTGHRGAFTLTGNGFKGLPDVFWSYSVPNLGRKLFQISVDYSSNPFSGIRSASFSRPLLSPLFRWGGGVAYGERNGNGGTSVPEQSELETNYRYVRQDAWVGYATQPHYIGKRRIKQFVFTGSYSLSDLLKKSDTVSVAPDPAEKNGYSQSFLATATFLKLHRYREGYIFSWEQVADYSEGISVSVTQGYIDQNDNAHHYSGLEVILARKFRSGYFSLQIQSGMRTSGLKVAESAAEFTGFYLSPLIGKGRYKFRAMLNGKYIAGGSDPVARPLVTDGKSEDIWQLNGRIFQALTRSSCELRMVMYTPWKPFDFELAPFVYGGFSRLKTWPQLGIEPGIFAAAGAGLILRSTKRAINVVRITFLFYPIVLGQSQPAYKIMPGWLFDMPNPNFEITGPLPAAGI